MKTINNKSLKVFRRLRSRLRVGRFVIKTCGMCYGCRFGLGCLRPFFVWIPF